MPAILDRILRAGEGKTLRKLKRIADQVNSIEDDFREMSDEDLQAVSGEFKERFKEAVQADADAVDEAILDVTAAKQALAHVRSQERAERENGGASDDEDVDDDEAPDEHDANDLGDPREPAGDPDAAREEQQKAEARLEKAKAKLVKTEAAALDELMPEAFAAAREAARRVLGQRHFDVQIMGGAALHMGNIAEMKTGEGKTLTAVLPAYLNALAGKGVHIVTVNDYLAKRDAEWMGRIHRFLGLEVGVILANMPPDERRKAYEADITYGTNNEFGFDYLRDNMSWSREERVQREHYYAIVDEVDSILIDEARTPLIISGPGEQVGRWYVEFAKIVPRLQRAPDRKPTDPPHDYDAGDYEVDEKKRTVGILERGVEKVEDILGIENLYEADNTPLIQYLNNAIKAKELYKRDKDYIVSDGEVLIVDEFTGRILHGRRYSEGMHQAIEAKEGVPIKDENQTLATITLQNYFRLYHKLAGMTGTAMTEANEFQKTYNIGVIPIPTNKPMIRDDTADVIYKTEDAKFEACAQDILERYEKGQPVLVGTTSVEKSERLAKRLKQLGVKHEVLNAKQHEREAAIIAEAGRKGGVTVATNMAGRGTDIMLGGNPEFLADRELHKRGLSPVETPDEYEAAYKGALEKAQEDVEAEHDEVVELGGLYVLGTERHEARRIDNQLRGRSGRQGDPGESRFYLSLEDDLMRRFNAAKVEFIYNTLKLPEDQPIDSGMVSKAIASAQHQVEQQNFEIRKDILKYDDVMDRQRKVIYAERQKILDGDDLNEQIRPMIYEVIDGYTTAATSEGFPEEWDMEKLWSAYGALFPISVSLDEIIEEEGDLANLTGEKIADYVKANAQAAYDLREEQLGSEAMRELERRVVLNVLDRKWREHLYEMDYLKEGIGLRGYAQRDPLVEYQREGYDMFATMLDGIKEETVGLLFNLDVQVEENPVVEEVDGVGDEAAEVRSILTQGLAEPDRPKQLQYSAPSETGEAAQSSGRSTGSKDRSYEGTSRNAPCPCGSGKKFKRCHGDPRNN